MKFKNKGIATIIIVASILIVSVAVGMASKAYLGNDNPVEQVAEEAIDEVIEETLKLPEGSVNIDLSNEKS
jgi:hypothetical protein